MITFVGDKPIHMKRSALIISMLLGMLCMAQAKDRIVERPPFLAQNSSSIEIDK